MTTSGTGALFPHWRGHEPFAHRVNSLRQALADANRGLGPLSESHAYERLAALLDAQNPMRTYAYVSTEVQAFIDSIDAAVRPAYLCGALLWFIDRFDETFKNMGLHQEFRLHFADAYHRQMDRIERGLEFASIHHDSFLKELGLARLRVIPAVGRVICPWSCLPRRWVFRGGPKSIAYVWGRCGGRTPFFQFHVHDQMVDYFSEAGYREAFRLAALLFPSFPKTRGLFGGSWYYDPQVAKISPRLSYLRELGLATGGRFIRVGPGDAQMATTKSPTRQRLYEEGFYRPEAYCLVCAESDLLRWPEASMSTSEAPQVASRRSAPC